MRGYPITCTWSTDTMIIKNFGSLDGNDIKLYVFGATLGSSLATSSH